MKIPTKAIDDLLVYLKLVEKTNQKLLLMYGVGALENNAFSKYYYNADEFSDSFFRVTGFEFDRTKNRIVTTHKNGILSVRDIRVMYSIKYLLEDLLNKRYDLIDTLKKYRNKAQHNPHQIGFQSIGNTNNEFDVAFDYKRKRYHLKSEDLRDMVVELNSAIVKLLDELWINIDLNTRTLINSKSKIESMLMSKKYSKFNELLLDNEKKYLIDLMED
jgi:hypothetical protein